MARRLLFPSPEVHMRMFKLFVAVIVLATHGCF